MAANGISTLANKEDRKIAKMQLAALKRQQIGTPGYRELNYYAGLVSPAIGRPWSTFAPIPAGTTITDENGNVLVDENGNIIVTE
jgi:hypothetical protein